LKDDGKTRKGEWHSLVQTEHIEVEPGITEPRNPHPSDNPMQDATVLGPCQIEYLLSQQKASNLRKLLFWKQVPLNREGGMSLGCHSVTVFSSSNDKQISLQKGKMEKNKVRARCHRPTLSAPIIFGGSPQSS
jgi:hypothetical protein